MCFEIGLSKVFASPRRRVGEVKSESEMKLKQWRHYDMMTFIIHSSK